MSAASYAVSAKARAKYGKFLTARDYSNLIACQSVPEVMVYLKSHTHFAKVLSDVNERDVHRGRLEMLLRQQNFNEFDSLCRYDSDVSTGFSRYVIARIEAEQILRFLILMSSNSTEKFIFQFPSFFAKHTEIDFMKLATADDYGEFLKALKNTPYYDALKRFEPDSFGKLPVSEIEMALYGIVYKELMGSALRNTKGQERDELQSLFFTINDYMIFSRILRMKKYYDLSPEDIRRNLFTEYSSINPKLLDEMCKAESSAEVFKVMQRARSGRMIKTIGYNYAGDITPRVKYKLAKHNLHFSTNPSVVMISFLFAGETELMNVISLIEGVRYKLDKAAIKSLLIY